MPTIKTWFSYRLSKTVNFMKDNMTSVGPLTESDHDKYDTDYVKGPTGRILKFPVKI